MSRWLDASFDGLVGPTHNYAGLSLGNVASLRNQGKASNPKAAALQGLAKMKALWELGIPQGILPPLPRPLWRVWHQLGYRGSKSQILEKLARDNPGLLASGWSASSMWVANAATVIPGKRAGTTHVIPANLSTTWHRSLEVTDTARVLRWAFPAVAGFIHHDPLPSHPQFADEGAANHTCLAPDTKGLGLHVFVHGVDKTGEGHTLARGKYPARQTLQASEAVARLADLPQGYVLHLRQHPRAIQAGVFHNDVIAVGQGPYWLVHQDAYADGDADVERVSMAYEKMFHQPLRVLRVSRKDLPLADAVTTYLFNSQWLNLPNGETVLVCARECRVHARAWNVIRRWQEQGLLSRALVMDLRQSMRNGGGPACLRLRVGMSEAQWKGIPDSIRYTPEAGLKLESWIQKHYRDRLLPGDLRDAQFALEVEKAVADLHALLGMDGILKD